MKDRIGDGVGCGGYDAIFKDLLDLLSIHLRIFIKDMCDITTNAHINNK